MDHKMFLANLAPSLKVQLTARKHTQVYARLAFHVGSIVALAVYIAAGQPMWWAVIPVLGVMLAFMFTIEHEATHTTIHSNATVNDWIGRICGFIILLPFEWFRWFHMAHHRYTNEPGKDPELAGGERPSTRLSWAWHVSGIPYWFAEVQVLLRLASGGATDGFLPPKAIARTVREARIMLALYVVSLASLYVSPLLFWVWLLPVFIGQMALRVFLLAEHVDCPHVTNMFENTRTTFTTRLVCLITWNASYHIEHHTYPTVPFYNLPLLHQAMRQELKVTADGYAKFTKDFLLQH
jgi:fatty acid desaturase